jgi:hypothetical protein
MVNMVSFFSFVQVARKALARGRIIDDGWLTIRASTKKMMNELGKVQTGKNPCGK